MDFWTIVLILAFLTGIMGWWSTVFTSVIFWYCEWRDGNDINWGADVALTLAVPFAWIFTIFEILLLYCK